MGIMRSCSHMAKNTWTLGKSLEKSLIGIAQECCYVLEASLYKTVEDLSSVMDNKERERQTDRDRDRES